MSEFAHIIMAETFCQEMMLTSWDDQLSQPDLFLVCQMEETGTAIPRALALSRSSRFLVPSKPGNGNPAMSDKCARAGAELL